MSLKWRKKTGNKGYTLTEIMIASAIASLVIGALLFLMIYVERTVVFSFHKTDLKKDVNYAMEFMVTKLRHGSRRFGLRFEDKIPNSEEYRRIEFFKNEEQIEAFLYEPANQVIKYQPNVDDPATQVLARNITDCRFFIDPPTDRNELEIKVEGEKTIKDKTYIYFVYNSASLRSP